MAVSNGPETTVAAESFAVDFDDVRGSFDVEEEEEEMKGFGMINMRSLAGAGAAALVPLVMGAAEASAKGGEFGIIEGKTASFFHPIVMVRSRLRFHANTR